MKLKMNTVGQALTASPQIGHVFQKITKTSLLPLVITPSQSLENRLLCIQTQEKQYAPLNHQEKATPKKPKVIFSSDSRQVDMYDSTGRHTSETFSSAQALAISYLKEQHQKGTTKVHYKTILDHINTTAIRMSDVFKICRGGKTFSHPLFGTLIRNDGKGYYWLEL